MDATEFQEVGKDLGPMCAMGSVLKEYARLLGAPEPAGIKDECVYAVDSDGSWREYRSWEELWCDELHPSRRYWDGAPEGSGN